MEESEQEHERLVPWISSQVQLEVDRLKAQGNRVIPLKTRNTGILRKKTKVINRLEVDTGFDFSKIKHILLSDSLPCPYKPNYYYVNVLMFTDKPVPLLVPYIYEKMPQNLLQEWMIVNLKGEKVHHQIDFAPHLNENDI